MSYDQLENLLHLYKISENREDELKVINEIKDLFHEEYDAGRRNERDNQ